MNDRPDTPDFTPLFEIAKQSDGMLVLDFCARIGARPYICHEDGEWACLSVGPWSTSDEGNPVIHSKAIDVNAEDVREMLDGARRVLLVRRDDTPFEEPVRWEYGNEPEVEEI